MVVVACPLPPLLSSLLPPLLPLLPPLLSLTAASCAADVAAVTAASHCQRGAAACVYYSPAGGVGGWLRRWGGRTAPRLYLQRGARRVPPSDPPPLRTMDGNGMGGGAASAREERVSKDAAARMREEFSSAASSLARLYKMSSEARASGSRSAYRDIAEWVCQRAVVPLFLSVVGGRMYEALLGLRFLVCVSLGVVIVLTRC